MNFHIILFFASGFALDVYKNVDTDHFELGKSIILGKIISNFLIRYFGEDQIFISIVLASSSKHRRYFHGDLFVNLFGNPVLRKFASNTMYKLDDAIPDHRNAFNLLLVDDSESFS